MKQLLNYLLNKRLVLRVIMFFLSDSKKEKVYIARFRAELEFFGHDTSDLSDDDIKDSMGRLGEMLTLCSFTTDEITKAFKVLATAFK